MKTVPKMAAAFLKNIKVSGANESGEAGCGLRGGPGGERKLGKKDENIERRELSGGAVVRI